MFLLNQYKPVCSIHNITDWLINSSNKCWTPCFSCNISKRCSCFDNLICVILLYLQNTPDDSRQYTDVIMSFLHKLTVQMNFFKCF